MKKYALPDEHIWIEQNRVLNRVLPLLQEAGLDPKTTETRATSPECSHRVGIEIRVAGYEIAYDAQSRVFFVLGFEDRNFPKFVDLVKFLKSLK